MNTPVDLISIVIPTHNRCTTLRRALDALDQQDFPVNKLEVIVVLDGCQDGTRAMLQSYTSTSQFRLVSIEQEQRGPAAARNRGAAKAGGKLLIFLDDDVIPSPGLIFAHVQAHAGREDCVVVGPYLPELRRNAGYEEMMLRAWWHDKFRSMAQPAHRFSYEDFLSGNCSMSQSLFTKVGGFDEKFPCAHEDYELGLRLLKANMTYLYCGAAHAIHDISHSSELSRMFLRTRREAQADVLIGIRHPELRPFLRLADFGHPSTRISRLMHSLAFSWQGPGDVLAAVLASVLRILQRLRLRRRWQRLYTGLTHYWYLRGLADKLGGRSALLTFLEDRIPDFLTPNEGESVEIDLGQGIEQALRQVDLRRPAAVRVVLGQEIVGCIAARPGREPLRGIHIRSVLGSDLLWNLFTAVMHHRVVDSPLEFASSKNRSSEGFVSGQP